jgi:stage III sporulation protein AH
VLYVNKKSALFCFLLAVFILVSGYSLFANRAQAPSGALSRGTGSTTAAPAGDQTVKTQPQVDLLPAMPDLTREEFFVECRLDRDRVRSEQVETLKEIAAQPDSSSEVRDSAQKDLMQLTENISQETELEKLVMARGYNDAAVMILPNSATVVVQVGSLPPSEVDQIKTLVSKTVGIDPGNVFVIPKA